MARDNAGGTDRNVAGEAAQEMRRLRQERQKNKPTGPTKKAATGTDQSTVANTKPVVANPGDITRVDRSKPRTTNNSTRRSTDGRNTSVSDEEKRGSVMASLGIEMEGDGFKRMF
jgi:hypothetical protein